MSLSRKQVLALLVLVTLLGSRPPDQNWNLTTKPSSSSSARPGSAKAPRPWPWPRRLGGEIINGDSMQVYRGFDIGTDKPPAEDRRARPPSSARYRSTPRRSSRPPISPPWRSRPPRRILGRGRRPVSSSAERAFTSRPCSTACFPARAGTTAVRAALERGSARTRARSALATASRRPTRPTPAKIGAARPGPHRPGARSLRP